MHCRRNHDVKHISNKLELNFRTICSRFRPLLLIGSILLLPSTLHANDKYRFVCSSYSSGTGNFTITKDLTIADFDAPLELNSGLAIEGMLFIGNSKDGRAFHLKRESRTMRDTLNGEIHNGRISTLTVTRQIGAVKRLFFRFDCSPE